MLGLDRVTFNPSVMGGQACIRGMRIPVSLVVNLVANDKPVAEILEEYPDLEPEDIRQSLFYAAWLPLQYDRFPEDEGVRAATPLEYRFLD